MNNAVTQWFPWVLACCVAGMGTMGCDWFGCGQDSTCRRLAPGSSNSSTGADSGGTGGTDGSGGSGGTAGSGGSEGTVCPEDPGDPAVNSVLSECGVWVRGSTPGDNINPGTQSQPVATMQRAIELAKKHKKTIFACGESYEEQVELPAGISLFGGFDCEDDWLYKGAANRAVIAAPAPDKIPLILKEGNGKSLIGDVLVQAKNAKEPGGSSIAVFAKDKAHAELRRSELIAGNGADGLDGADGSHGNKDAHKGLSGISGADACSMDEGLGGKSVVLQCPDGTYSKSGYAGDGGIVAASDGADGEPMPNPNPQGFGEGGKAADPAQGLECTGGAHGANGLDGANGERVHGNGKLTTEGVVIGNAGEDGKPGQPGQGGGGGGASLGSVLLCGGAFKGGAGGGSGGTGGCGGEAGKGGQAGGSSIGLLTWSSDIIVAPGVKVTLGNGGRGGKGGVLQAGGGSGLPGVGGMGLFNGVEPGCPGGVGGQGGKGGNGAGGHGGHSVGYAFSSKIVFLGFNGSVINGMPGEGGYGGNPAIPESNADFGTQADGISLDP